jgi:hypothetical protein
LHERSSKERISKPKAACRRLPKSRKEEAEEVIIL